LKPKLRLVAIALAALLILTSASPTRANAIVVGDLILVGTVVTAGVLYYVWQNQKTHKKIYTIEDPEDLKQWGVYRARDKDHCRYLAAGRDWDWRNGKCYIKG